MASSVSPIFVSYSEGDGDDLADAIKKQFSKWGYDIFVARRDIPVGENWDKLIKRKLANCKSCVLLITEGALRSDYVNIEVSEAKKYKKDIVPCKYEEVERKDIKWELNDIQMITFETKGELLRKLSKYFRDTEGRKQGISKSLTLSIDKTLYRADERIKVTGTVPAVFEGVPIVIQIFDPLNRPILIDQPSPNAYGNYYFDFMLRGEQIMRGVYTIRATYLGQSVPTKFEFTTIKSIVPTYTIKFGGTNFNVTASLSNGNIGGIFMEPKLKSIVAKIMSRNRDGIAELTLPRQLIDARNINEDDDFIVLVDGEEAGFDEMETTSIARKLRIPIPKDSAEIEIIGTVVFPSEETEQKMVAVLIPKGACNVSNKHFFIPKEIMIQKGTKVIWTNSDSATHTVTSGDVDDPENWGKIFESGLNKPGTTFEWTFDTAGEYPYLCMLHPWMIGKIRVTEENVDPYHS
ncbi:MAG: TIR domain-containing protein [Nitrososphaerales archaeon]